MQENIVITMQARMGSTRFPGKVLAKLGPYPVLEYMVYRLKRSRLAKEIFLATTTDKKDDSIVALAEAMKLKYHRGSEQDVLGRVYETAQMAKADVIVHTTSDCPMIDATLIDKGLQIFLRAKHDCVGVGMEKSYPHGLDFYIIGRKLLEEMNAKVDTEYTREHVIEYVTSKPQKFDCFYMKAPEELARPDVRITVDYKEDLETLNKMLKKLGEHNLDYSIKEIIEAWDWVKSKAVV